MLGTDVALHRSEGGPGIQSTVQPGFSTYLDPLVGDDWEPWEVHTERERFLPIPVERTGCVRRLSAQGILFIWVPRDTLLRNRTIGLGYRLKMILECGLGIRYRLYVIRYFGKNTICTFNALPCCIYL